jgi:hypothetical protein
MTTRNHPVKRPSLADVTANGSGLPSRGVGHGPEGVGKTSLGCATPKPIFIMTRGETAIPTALYEPVSHVNIR